MSSHFRFRTLEVRGFRSFGATGQRFELSDGLTIIRGSNSQGKTGLAEAIEFLFAGKCSRRDLSGSTKSEHEKSLRNVFIDDSESCSVTAHVQLASGEQVVVYRELLSDYQRGSDPTSTLKIDGREATDLSSLRLPTLDEPLAAPVLMQHSLRYLLTAGPKERGVFFRSLLDVSDLDAVRERVNEAIARLSSEPDIVLLSEFEAFCEEVGLRTPWRTSNFANADDVERFCYEVLEAVDPATPRGDKPTTLDGYRDRLRADIEETVRGAIDLQFYDIPSLNSVALDLDLIGRYSQSLSDVDSELRAFAAVYTAAVDANYASDPADCPVCGTPSALSAERLSELRDRLAALSGLDLVRKAMASALNSAISSIQRNLELVERCLKSPEEIAARVATDAETLRSLGVESSSFDALIDKMRTARPHLEGLIESDLNTLVREAVDLSGSYRSIDELPLKSSAEEYNSLVAAFSAATAGYSDHIDQLRRLVSAKVGGQQTRQIEKGLLTTRSTQELMEGLTRRRSRDSTVRRARAAAAQIQKSMNAVIDARYDNMSGEISRWWKSLRQDELVSFQEVRRRPGGSVFLDLVAALKASTEVGEVASRDAIGVFSDSQLNALGLSLFLARLSMVGYPFVVLDDPLPGYDTEHRSNFSDDTVRQLLADDVQVLLHTHDEHIGDTLTTLYWRGGARTYAIELEDVRQGSELTELEDEFDRYMRLAEDNYRGVTKESRERASQYFRKAAERLARQIVATGKTAEGAPTGVAELNGLDLGSLIKQLYPFSSNDQSGKWDVLPKQLNSGNHDDVAKSKEDLANVRGNLRRFRQEYGGRWLGGLLR